MINFHRLYVIMQQQFIFYLTSQTIVSFIAINNYRKKINISWHDNISGNKNRNNHFMQCLSVYMKPLNFSRYASRLSTEGTRKVRKISAVRVSPWHALPLTMQPKVNLTEFCIRNNIAQELCWSIKICLCWLYGLDFAVLWVVKMICCDEY